MKFIRYGKYVGEPADAVDLEELVKRMGDFFLQSGFESQFYGVSQMDSDRSMEALREAILRALEEGDLLPEDAMSEELRKMLQSPDAQNNQAVKDLLDKLMERLAQEGFINPQQPPQVTPPPETSARGQLGPLTTRHRRPASKSPTKPSISWASRPYKTFSARWAAAVLDVTTRVTSPPASSPAAYPDPTNSATR
jgi:hypothetical protein